MTYYGSRQLAESFRTVRKNTLAIAEEIPEDKYSFKATPEVMSVAEMLAHMAVNPSWQIDLHRDRIDHVDRAIFMDRVQTSKAAEKALQTKAEIVAALRDGGEQFAAFVESLDEAALAAVISFPPPVEPASRTRFEMLLGVKEHEMHHRGQLMLIQRLLGQVPHLTRRRQERMTEPAVSR
jgi:uncharacterized damage-inducible protein DinB